MSEKQYAERDAMALEKAGGWYSLHVSAMTTEGLHSKSDIAAELAWRDVQIMELKGELLDLKIGFRKCEFCGCRSNAKSRACCEKGREADKLSSAPAAQPEDGELETRHQMLKSWLVEADASNERLKKHLHRALEIAYTWQPVYATKMDLDTLAHAATDSGFEHHGIKEQP